MYVGLVICVPAFYSAEVLVTQTDLEAFFRRQGHPDWADQVFREGKDRELMEVLPYRSVAWFWNGFLKMFVGYGRRPAFAFVWSFIVIFIVHYPCTLRT